LQKDKEKEGGIILFTNAPDQEIDPAWISVTSKKFLWDTFFFATFRNPSNELLSAYKLNTTDLPYYLQIFGGGHYAIAKEWKNFEENLADHWYGKEDNETEFDLAYYSMQAPIDYYELNKFLMQFTKERIKKIVRDKQIH